MDTHTDNRVSTVHRAYGMGLNKGQQIDPLTCSTLVCLWSESMIKINNGEQIHMNLLEIGSHSI